MPTSEPPITTSAFEERYLSLSLGSQCCTIPISRVSDIVRLPSFGGVLKKPDSVQGVLHLHGQTIPVVDIRTTGPACLSPTTDRTCVVVVQCVDVATKDRLVGLVVDSVREVADITRSDLAQSPRPTADADPGWSFLDGTLRSLVRSLAHAPPIPPRQRSPSA